MGNAIRYAVNTFNGSLQDFSNKIDPLKHVIATNVPVITHSIYTVTQDIHAIIGDMSQLQPFVKLLFKSIIGLVIVGILSLVFTYLVPGGGSSIKNLIFLLAAAYACHYVFTLDSPRLSSSYVANHNTPVSTRAVSTFSPVKQIDDSARIYVPEVQPTAVRRSLSVHTNVSSLVSAPTNSELTSCAPTKVFKDVHDRLAFVLDCANKHHLTEEDVNNIKYCFVFGLPKPSSKDVIVLEELVALVVFRHNAPALEVFLMQRTLSVISATAMVNRNSITAGYYLRQFKEKHNIK